MVGNRTGRRHISPADDMALKRLAIQIAAQLPDDLEHAQVVLDYTREMLGSFLGVPGADGRNNPPIALVKP